MIISVINHTNGDISDEDLQGTIRVINYQIAEDFEPYWSLGARLRLEGRSGKKPSKNNLADMRGDAVLYLWNGADVDDALGYHDENNRGIPYGFVFTKLSKELGENWTVTLSHEALELIGDPENNLLVQGPHPEDPKRTVFHWFEMCDAVQEDTYTIDGIEVSNFVLPLYFTEGRKDARNDFLHKAHHGQTLRAFRTNPGGYVGYFNPTNGRAEVYVPEGDTQGVRRAQIKMRLGLTRRSQRYEYRISSHQPVRSALRKFLGSS